MMFLFIGVVPMYIWKHPKIVYNILLYYDSSVSFVLRAAAVTETKDGVLRLEPLNHRSEANRVDTVK
jgi:hypothetical protein